MSEASGFTRGYGLLEGFLARKRAQKANSFISKKERDGRILDIGCGSYPYFLLSTEFAEKYGIDPSLRLSVIQNKKITLKRLDVTLKSLPFEDNYFDVITMLAVFEHIDNKKLKFVLRDIKRVLKNRGIFIITTPAPWSDKLLHQMARIGLISSEEIHEHKHNHAQKSIEAILCDAGFEKNKIKSGFFEYGLNMWFTAEK